MPSLAGLPRWSIEILRFAAMIAIALTVATVYTARGDNHDTTYWACLYAGSLSQVGTTEPTNCGRGAAISWNAQGVEGVSGYEVVTSETAVTVPAGSWLDHSVDCPDGKVALGGGPYFAAFLTAGLVTVESYPHANGTSWIVFMSNPTNTPETFFVRATCATMAVED